MQLHKTLLFGIFFALLTAGYSCPIEREWQLDVFLKEALSKWEMGAFKQAHVLAWKSMEDARPYYAEDCIAIIEREKKWVLVRLGRNPRESYGKTWQPVIIYDVPQNPIAEFDKKPTKKELIRFLETSWWHFNGEDGMSLVRSGICERTLKELFDMTPAELMSAKTK